MIQECLSILELLELRASSEAEGAAASLHVRECPRCAGLMRTLPDLNLEEEREDTPQFRAQPAAPREKVEQILAGQIWRAGAPDLPDRRYVVVVLGRRRDATDTVVVAPTSTAINQATELDLVVEDSDLGYQFLVSVWNFGTVYADQLEEYLGSLPGEHLDALKSLYEFVVKGEGRGVLAGTGVSTAGRDDERLIWRSEQLARLRPLWRPRHKRLAEEEVGEPAGRVESGQSDQPFSMVLWRLFEEGEWDTSSLAEAAHVSSPHIEALLADRLDLTDQRDADSVASVINALHLDFEDVEPALRRTLRASPGGLRVGTTDAERMAARSFADVSEERRSKELYDEHSMVDESEGARQRAIESYLQAVASRLDELS